MQLSSAILTGGKSSRMSGQDKAQLEINGKRLIDLQLDVFDQIFDKTIIIGKGISDKNIDCFEDTYNNCGPIAGIHSALTNCNADYIFIVPCDLPFLSEQLIKDMIIDLEQNPTDILIPKHGDKIEPLHAFYHKSSLSVVQKLLVQGDFKIRNLFSFLNIRYFNVNLQYKPELSFFNINKPEDLIKAQEYAKIFNK